MALVSQLLEEISGKSVLEGETFRPSCEKRQINVLQGLLKLLAFFKYGAKNAVQVCDVHLLETAPIVGRAADKVD